MVEGFVEWFKTASPVLQALVAGLLTWSLTAIGAAAVVFTGRMSKAFLDSMLGFAAGVMIAASFWSLLLPAVEMVDAAGTPAWLPAAVGFTLGGVLLRVADQYLPHLHPGLPDWKVEGVKTSWNRTTLLVMAITLHNIPEGLAVGVAFGAGAALGPEGDQYLAGAVALSIGIGLQNLPEGLAVALPLRGAGASRLKSFWYGQLSAIVEPIAAVLGAVAVVAFRPILPYALGFAAGAMIYVVVEELIPESHANGYEDLATLATMGGFVVMMILDVGVG